MELTPVIVEFYNYLPLSYYQILTRNVLTYRKTYRKN
jgi:hypothetical protein